METFYDENLKDIWDSDLDPTDSLKLSADTEMHDWFLERDVKIPTVILNDKLISDALFNGTLPIKSEHSYSLNSDGDSMPDSPGSLHTKIEDMDDDYYPAISLKSATCATRRLHTATIDPNCLTIATVTTATATATTPASATCLPVAISTLTTCPSSHSSANPMLTATSTAALLSSASNSNTSSSSGSGGGGGGSNSHSSLSSNIYAGLNRMASAPMTFNLRTLTTSSSNLNNNNISSYSNSNSNNTNASITKQLQLQVQLQQQQQQLQQQQMLLQQQRQELNAYTTVVNTACTSPATTREGSVSPDICSDIEIDESCIKDEPMSPSSSYPPSPNGTLSLNMANVAAYTNSDLVFEHKNGSLQLTPASQSLLKSQQYILSSNGNGQSIVIPKVNIKTESTASSSCSSSNNGNTLVVNNASNGSSSFGLPPTPPSSMPSDDSEGNQSPEHLLSPLSPSSTGNTINTSAVNTAPATGSNSTITITSASATSARRSTSSSSSSSSSQSNSPASSSSHAARAFSGNSTRQPIHTPLISSQPKGSTGTLILTEEEKRTLLAEGYPIPQRLPLTKAEEKSLKKIRRKIKNKISAQESRRKKKEYMDQLERKVEVLVNENIDYKKRVESLEDSNASLLSQLQKLQALVNKQNPKKA